MAPKIGNVAAAAREAAKRQGAIGPTIRVRATARGFYGHPLEVIREPGQEFPFATKDLEPWSLELEKLYATTPTGSHETVILNGSRYFLPSWVVDAKKPVARPEPEDEVSYADADMGGDVI